MPHSAPALSIKEPRLLGPGVVRVGSHVQVLAAAAPPPPPAALSCSQEQDQGSHGRHRLLVRQTTYTNFLFSVVATIFYSKIVTLQLRTLPPCVPRGGGKTLQRKFQAVKVKSYVEKYTGIKLEKNTLFDDVHNLH